MDSGDLRPDQAMAITLRAADTLAFLGRMLRRMESLGFPPNDELYQATTDAYNAVHALRIKTHYLSVKSGVGACEK